MATVSDEIVDFIGAGSTPDAVVHFEPSQQTKDYVAELIRKEKTASLSSDESSEIEHFIAIEHLLRLAKARAKAYERHDKRRLP